MISKVPMTAEKLDKELDPINIAVPVAAKIRRSCYGHFLGPCFLYYARAGGIEVHGNSPNEAADRLARALTRDIGGRKNE
ncbi:hypothetical protein KA005_28435 [bacterium]|nr:hypothetical protein [bacterium]